MPATAEQGRGLRTNRDFRLWYTSRTISVAGTQASAVALPLLAYQTSASPRLTALVVGLEAVPYLLFGVFTGAAADRLPRKAMMVGADLAAAVLLSILVLAHAVDMFTSWQVLAAAFGVGCCFCFFDSAAWGAEIRLVGKSRIAQANSLMWFTEVVLDIGAPAMAGLASAAADPIVVIAFDAGTYLVSAAFVIRIRGSVDVPRNRTATAGRMGAEIGQGLAYLWRQPIIRTLSLAGFGFNAAYAGTLGLLVVHADRVLGLRTPDPRLGFLYTAAAVGALAAAAALPPMSRGIGHGPVSVVGYGTFVIAVVGLCVTSTLAAALLLWLCLGFARLVVNGNGITVRQLLTPDVLQGRVNTTGRMIAWGGTPFGAVLGGMVAEAAGVRLAYLTLAVPGLIGLVVLLVTPVRNLRIAIDPHVA